MSGHSIWRAPVALSAISLLGLVAGLLGDDAWDWACWLGLGLPVAVCAWYGTKRTRPRAEQSRPRLPTIDG